MSDPRSRPGIRLADLPVGVRPCSLAAALDVLGERWSLLALREMFPVMLALYQWGDKWAVDTPFLTRRHTCGQPLEVDLVCHHCGQPVTRDTIHAELARA